MATYYVSTSGNDSTGNGSIGSPWRTINKGVSVLVAGDTLFVRSGTYNEALINNIPSGTSWTNKVRIANYSTETVWITPTDSSQSRVVEFGGSQKYIEFDGINMDGSVVFGNTIKLNGTTDGDYAHHIRVQNAEIIGPSRIQSPDFLNGPQAILVVQTNNNPSNPGGNEFINLKVHRVQGSGFYLQSDFNLVDGCEIYSCATGVELNNSYPGMSVDNTTVRNCRIHDLIPDPNDGRCRGIVAIGTSNLYYNNVIYSITGTSSTTAGIHLFYGSTSQIYFNTIYGVNFYGILIENTTNAIVQNNISYSNGNACQDNGVGTTRDHNLFDVNPLFVSTSSKDFHLTSGSSARGFGVAINGIATDKDNIARTNPPDVGAYQYVTGHTYYVATTGSDTTGTGTFSSPWRTLNKGVSVLAPGDTLLVRGGTYDESLINNVPSGTSWTNKVRIAAYTGETVWMAPTGSPNRVLEFGGSSVQQYIEFDGLNYDGANCIYDVIKIYGLNASQNGQYIRIQHGEVLAPIVNSGTNSSVTQIILTATFAADLGSHIEFRYLTIHRGATNQINDFGPHGIYCNSADSLIEYCELYDVGGNAIQVYNGNGGSPDRTIVRFNKIHDITSVQPASDPALGARHRGIIVAAGHDQQIYGNVIWNVSANSYLDAGIEQAYATNVLIAFNTVYNCKTGIYLSGNGGNNLCGITVRDNICYGNTGGNGDFFDVCVDTTKDHNLFGVDPQFVGTISSANHVPPATSITDSTGAVWTLGTATPFPEILRNGVQAGGAFGQQIMYCGSTIYIQGDDLTPSFYRWNGAGWDFIGNSDPCPVSTNDFHIATASSPAINAGLAISGITTDIDNVVRGNPPEIGAYEYTGSVSTGNTYYVSTTGNDSTGTGSITKPWRTINKGISSIAGGDTLYIRGGNYDETIFDTIPSGTATAYTKIVAYPGERPWIIPPAGTSNAVHLGNSSNQHYIEFDGINVDGTTCAGLGFICHIECSAQSGTEAHHMRWKNSELIMGPAFVCFLNSGDLVNAVGSNEFINNKIHGNTFNGTDPTHLDTLPNEAFYIGTSNNIIDGNEIYDVLGGGGQAYNGYGQPADNNTFRNNYWHDITQWQDFDASQRVYALVIYGYNVTNTKVYNNIVARIGTGLANHYGIFAGGGATNTEFYFNTVYGCQATGIAPNADGLAQGGACKNNIAYNNSPDIGASSGSTLSNNLTGTNPLFVNTSVSDFHLTSGSPARGYGLAISGYSVDKDNVARTNPPDVGAYQFKSGSSITGAPANSAGHGTATLTGKTIAVLSGVFSAAGHGTYGATGTSQNFVSGALSAVGSGTATLVGVRRSVGAGVVSALGHGTTALAIQVIDTATVQSLGKGNAFLTGVALTTVSGVVSPAGHGAVNPVAFILDTGHLSAVGAGNANLQGLAVSSNSTESHPAGKATVSLAAEFVATNQGAFSSSGHGAANFQSLTLTSNAGELHPAGRATVSLSSEFVATNAGAASAAGSGTVVFSSETLIAGDTDTSIAGRGLTSIVGETLITTSGAVSAAGKSTVNLPSDFILTTAVDVHFSGRGAAALSGQAVQNTTDAVVSASGVATISVVATIVDGSTETAGGHGNAILAGVAFTGQTISESVVALRGIGTAISQGLALETIPGVVGAVGSGEANFVGVALNAIIITPPPPGGHKGPKWGVHRIDLKRRREEKA